MSPRRLVAWTLLGVAVGLAALGCVLNALAGSHGEPWWQSALDLLGVLACGSVGLLIALRRGHPIGWLLLVDAVLLAGVGVAQGYSRYALLEQPGALPGAEWAVLWDEAGWPLLFAVLTAIVFVFPDGRLPSPRWRPVAGGSAAAFAAFVVLAAFNPEPFEAPFEQVQRPLPALPGAMAVLWPFALLGMLVGLVAAARAARLRFRHAKGAERLQLKWLALTAMLVPTSLLICAVGALVTDAFDDQDVFNTLFFFTLAAVPISIGVAVLRYRLYDNDRVINRTLVYGMLSATLAGTYLATVLLLQVLLAPLTEQSDPAIAGSTLAVAGLSGPARRRIQAMVDRRFYRSRYDATRTLEGFGVRLRDEVNLETLAIELQAVVGSTTQPSHVSLWLRDPGR